MTCQFDMTIRHHGGTSVGFSPLQNIFVSNVVMVHDAENASEAPLVEHVQLVDNAHYVFPGLAGIDCHQ